MDVNVKNVNRLADFIKSCKRDFDMRSSEVEPKSESHTCGTAGCIAGHAALLWPSCRLMTSVSGYYSFNDDKVAKKLGLDDEDFDKLAYPYRSRDGVDLDTISSDKDWAIRCLTNLAKTGEVDWNKTRRD